MKNMEIITEGITLMDEVFRNRGRQNFIGTLITRIGLTVTALGITVILNKPENLVSESEQSERKTELKLISSICHSRQIRAIFMPVFERRKSMSKWDINWKYTYKKTPKEVREFLKQLLGMKEYKKLMQAIRTHKWIMMVGPECSGKSTVVHILRTLGYPFVMDDNGLGRVIHTSRKLTDLRHTDVILEELGIGSKH